MNLSLLVDALRDIVAAKGYEFHSASPEHISSLVRSYPAALLPQPEFREMEGRNHGKITYRLTLYLMVAGVKIRPDDVTGTVDALENDALEIFSELSSDQYVAAVLDLTMTPMQRPMTSHGDVSLAVGADVVCVF